MLDLGSSARAQRPSCEERFSHALQSGQMDLAQFGLSSGTGFGVADFLQAIQSQVEAEGTEEAGKEEGGKEEPGGDDSMAE